MNKPEAEQIAAAISMIRPQWLKTSLVTALGNLPAHLRERPARDVHLALLWLAYDPKQETPRLLREDGPWWNLASMAGPQSQTTEPRILTRCEHGIVGARCPDCYPTERRGTSLSPEMRERMRADIREARES